MPSLPLPPWEHGEATRESRELTRHSRGTDWVSRPRGPVLQQKGQGPLLSPHTGGQGRAGLPFGRDAWGGQAGWQTETQTLQFPPVLLIERTESTRMMVAEQSHRKATDGICHTTGYVDLYLLPVVLCASEAWSKRTAPPPPR